MIAEGGLDLPKFQAVTGMLRAACDEHLVSPVRERGRAGGAEREGQRDNKGEGEDGVSKRRGSGAL